MSNDAAGWAKLVEQLRGSSITAIGVEASGGYERGVVRALLAAGMSVRQINPFKLRQFAKASGTLAKNDRLDARDRIVRRHHANAAGAAAGADDRTARRDAYCPAPTQ